MQVKQLVCMCEPLYVTVGNELAVTVSVCVCVSWYIVVNMFCHRLKL